MDNNVKLALDCAKANKMLEESINEVRKIESVLARAFEFQALGIARSLEDSLREMQITNGKVLYYNNVLEETLNGIIEKYNGK